MKIGTASTSKTNIPIEEIGGCAVLRNFNFTYMLACTQKNCRTIIIIMKFAKS